MILAISLQFEPSTVGVEAGKRLHFETQKNVKLRKVFGLVTSTLSCLRGGKPLLNTITEERRIWELDGLSDYVVDQLINLRNAKIISHQEPLFLHGF
jgi:hypothetical protein